MLGNACPHLHSYLVMMYMNVIYNFICRFVSSPRLLCWRLLFLPTLFPFARCLVFMSPIPRLVLFLPVLFFANLICTHPDHSLHCLWIKRTVLAVWLCKLRALVVLQYKFVFSHGGGNLRLQCCCQMIHFLPSSVKYTNSRSTVVITLA